MPGHTFLYSPPVNKVRELIDEDVLGEVYFVTSSRMNLGKYQPDGVICDLAPHDLSILLHWIEQPVVQVGASARGRLPGGRAGDGVPHPDVRERRARPTSRSRGWPRARSARWSSSAAARWSSTTTPPSDEAVRVYDRGMEFSTPSNFGEYQLTYRSGDIIIPRLDAAEPLGLELADFAHVDPHGDAPALARRARARNRAWRWKRPRSRCAATASRCSSSGCSSRSPPRRGRTNGQEPPSLAPAAPGRPAYA